MDGDVVILGGGLAGLSAACHSGFPVYEAAAGPGGTAASVSADGYVFDLGIHVLHTRKREVLDLLAACGLALRSHKRRGWIYSHGRYALYPFQVNTSHLPLRTRLRCVRDYLWRRASADPADYRAWMIANFGRGLADVFMIPYAEKFWRVPAEEMTHEWTGARVPRVRLWDLLVGMWMNRDASYGQNAVFSYPEAPGAGFGEVARALATRVSRIHHGHRATAIRTHDRAIVFNGGERVVPYRLLLSSIPLPELVALLDDVPASVREATGRLRHNSIAVVNVGVGRAALSDKHWVHFPDPGISFFRIAFPNNFAEGLSPPGTGMIQTEVAYDKAAPPDRASLVDAVVRDLRRVGVLAAADEIAFADVRWLPYGYVIHDRHRKQAVETIHAHLASIGIHAFGRYGSWEYFWSDDAILDGRRAAELALRAAPAGSARAAAASAARHHPAPGAADARPAVGSK
jgi:protoporphyrinogen oxidase